MEQVLKPCQLIDEKIIENLKSSGIDKRKAEEQLFSRYYYFICIGESKFSLCKEDLFDAYSDTVMAVIYSVSNSYFQNRSSLKTFIYEIFHNKCVDLIRKKATRKNAVHKTESINEMQSTICDNSVSIIEKLTRQSELQRIMQKMNYLSEGCQEILLLSVDGYSDKEIALMTKFKTTDVVKTSRQRGLKKLRQLVSWQYR